MRPEGDGPGARWLGPRALATARAGGQGLHPGDTRMRQLSFVEPGTVRWEEAPDARLETPDDALVRPLVVTTCDIDHAIVHGLVPFRGPFRSATSSSRRSSRPAAPCAGSVGAIGWSSPSRFAAVDATGVREASPARAGPPARARPTA
jgi:hypothetical protein